MKMNGKSPRNKSRHCRRGIEKRHTDRKTDAEVNNSTSDKGGNTETANKGLHRNGFMKTDFGITNALCMPA
jgi:hypothetical protein